MDYEIAQEAYGRAAFAVLERILPKLMEQGVFGRIELKETLQEIAGTYSSRGVADNNDVQTDVARAVGILANAVQVHPEFGD